MAQLQCTGPAQTNEAKLCAGMVKYGFPLASTVAMLAWGMLEFPGVSPHIGLWCLSAQSAACSGLLNAVLHLPCLVTCADSRGGSDYLLRLHGLCRVTARLA